MDVLFITEKGKDGASLPKILAKEQFKT